MAYYEPSTVSRRSRVDDKKGFGRCIRRYSLVVERDVLARYHTGPHTALPLIDRYQPIAVNLRDLRRNLANQSVYKPSFDETPSISSYNSTGYTLIRRGIRRDTPDCKRTLLLTIFTVPFRSLTRTIILDLIRLTEQLYKCRHF